jgi:aminobenzoyl-glutamate transport protein
VSTAPAAAGGRGLLARSLDAVERVGNAVPHPAIMFLALCGIVIVLSQVLSWAGVSATYEVVKPPPQALEQELAGGSVAPVQVLPPEPADASDYEVTTETAEVEGLLTADGVRFLFTSFVSNFMGFTALGIILIVMIGVGLAEAAGLISALIRTLVAVSSVGALTYIIAFLGVLSSIAADAGYLVLIPLGAVAFRSVGRHPLAGIAVAFAGVAGGFGVNLLVTPTDAVLTEITNESIHLVDPGISIDLTANLYFGIGSTILVTVLAAVITTRVVEPRLGAYDAAYAPAPGEGIQDPDAAPEVTEEAQGRGLRWAMIGLLVYVAGIAALTVPPGAPLRDPDTGEVIGTSPFMDSLIVIIALAFLVAGACYGRGAGTIRTANAAIEAITKAWGTLAALLLLFLLIAQFIAYFNYSNMAQVAAVTLGDTIERLSIDDVWLLLVMIGITLVIGIIIPQAIAKWALLAPIFIPLCLRLGIEPQTALAAYRVADSPMNIFTPIMPYFPLIVVFAARYDKRSGIGTVIALMLPYTIALIVIWTAFFMVWWALGIPMGPGAPA